MTHCRRCQLPDKLFGTAFDNQGVCNYCSYWDTHQEKYTSCDQLLPRFGRRLEKVRGRYPYDALVGISGGKDSTYVLYRLVEEYGLRVKGITFDNGFLSDYGRDNITRAVKALGVEPEFFTPDRTIHNAFYRAAYQVFGDPCIGCAIPMYCVVLKLCQQRGIPFFIHGRSPFQMFRNFKEGSSDIYIAITDTNLEEHNIQKLTELHQQFDARVQRWLGMLFQDSVLRERAYREFFLDPTALTPELVPEFLGFFAFHPYDEELMKQVAAAKVGYSRPRSDMLLGHADCNIHKASEYLFEQIHGSPMVLLEVATMMRRGLLSTSEAESLLSRSHTTLQDARESLELFCGTVGLDPQGVAVHIQALKAAGSKFDCH